jgi:hypothetical protein
VKIELEFKSVGDSKFLPPWWVWNVITTTDVSEYPGLLRGVDFSEDDAFQQAMDAKESLVDWYWKTNQLELW